jgi:hypothetical protein
MRPSDYGWKQVHQKEYWLSMKKFVTGYCVVCSKALEDPVSLTTNMGPICRNKANELLAKSLPSSLGTQDSIVRLMKLSNLGESEAVQERLCSLQALFMNQQDHRTAVTEAASLLNQVTQQTSNLLCDLIRDAGYARYLSYILGLCASSADNKLLVEVSPEGNTLVRFYGVRSSHGRDLMRAAYIRFVYGGTQKGFQGCYSVNIAEKEKVEKLIGIVEEGWPFTKELDTQVAAVREALAKVEPPKPTAVEEQVAHKRVADYLMNLAGGYVLFTTPSYNKEGVEAIKAIPSRRFFPKESSPSGKPAWAVNQVWQANLEEVARKHWNLEIED